MKKNEFCRFLHGKLMEFVDDNGKRPFEKLSAPNAEAVIEVFFKSVIEVVSQCAEVRVNSGAFYPKIMQSHQRTVNVRLGFKSFVETNRRLFGEFAKMPTLGVKAGEYCEVFSVAGASRVVDDAGRTLLGMTEVSSRSGVSLPTCYRYVKQEWFTTMAKEVALVADNGTGKRYSEAVVGIFKAKKQDNETKVAGATMMDGEPVFALSCLSRDMGVSTSAIHKIVRDHGITVKRAPWAPDRYFFTQAAVDSLKKAVIGSG